MSHYLPEQGDVVMIDFDPATGREIQKRRPALVMSKSIMAKHTGLVLVCPITSTVRGTELEVAVNGEKISGVALSVQLRSMDFRRRNVEFVEQADADVVEKMSELLQDLVKY
ncbi:type II toxin-antitoxin system PemK/MazF family toxin [Cardiobacterium hominis]|jgi:putative transcriptional regulator pemk-like protein